MNLKMADKSPEQEKIEKRRLVSAHKFIVCWLSQKIACSFIISCQ